MALSLSVCSGKRRGLKERHSSGRSTRLTWTLGAQPIGSSWAPQFTTGVDATYRGKLFEVTAGGGYGRGAPREGGGPGYQSLNGTLRVRIDWP